MTNPADEFTKAVESALHKLDTGEYLGHGGQSAALASIQAEVVKLLEGLKGDDGLVSCAECWAVILPNNAEKHNKWHEKQRFLHESY